MLGFLKKVLTLHQLLGASVGLVPPPGARRSASVSGKVLSIESSTAKQCYCPRAHACAWLPAPPHLSPGGAPAPETDRALLPPGAKVITHWK